MDHNRQKLSGVFAPVVTPFEGDEPDLDALTFNLVKLRQTGLTGYLALGSNGEARSLTDEERLLVLEVFKAEKGDKVVMVGTGFESTKETVEKSQELVDRTSVGSGHDGPRIANADYSTIISPFITTQ